MQFVEVQWFADKIVGAQLKRGLHVVQLRIGGDHDDRAGVAILLELIEDFETAYIGHTNVEQHQVGRLMLGHFQPGLARLRLADVVSPFLALLAERPAHQALVIDNEDLLGGH